MTRRLPLHMIIQMSLKMQNSSLENAKWSLKDKISVLKNPHCLSSKDLGSNVHFKWAETKSQPPWNAQPPIDAKLKNRSRLK